MSEDGPVVIEGVYEVIGDGKDPDIPTFQRVDGDIGFKERQEINAAIAPAISGLYELGEDKYRRPVVRSRPTTPETQAVKKGLAEAGVHESWVSTSADPDRTDGVLYLKRAMVFLDDNRMVKTPDRRTLTGKDKEKDETIEMYQKLQNHTEDGIAWDLRNVDFAQSSTYSGNVNELRDLVRYQQDYFQSFLDKEYRRKASAARADRIASRLVENIKKRWI